MKYDIRPATIKDLDTIVSYILQEAKEAETLEIPIQKINQGVRFGLENPDIVKYWLVVNEDKEPIASFSIVKEWNDWNAGFYWWVKSMFISGEYRGKGLMDLIIDHVKLEGKKNEVLEIKLCVHFDNYRVIRSYIKQGFKKYDYEVMGIKL